MWYSIEYKVIVSDIETTLSAEIWAKTEQDAKTVFCNEFSLTIENIVNVKKFYK